MTIPPLELRHRAWQNPHQQRLKERTSLCNKCSIGRRHNSHCHSMPVLMECLRPAPRQGCLGTVDPSSPAQRHAGRYVWGHLSHQSGQRLRGPAEAVSWGRSCWCPLGPGIGRWACTAASGGRPRVGTLGTKDQVRGLWASLAAALWKEVHKRKYL